MDFSIVLPAYNEAGNLPPLLKNLKTELDGLAIKYEIIVVDNGSSDNTGEVLTSLKTEIPELRSVRVLPNIGFGNGVLQGLSVAQGDVLGFIDADGQIEAKYLVDAYLKLEEEGLDLCKGRRITRNDGRLRRTASMAYNFLFRFVFGGNIADLNTKPKVLTRKFYEGIKPVSKDWFLDSEIVLKAVKKKHKIGEIDIIFLARTKGKSKVRISTVFEFFKNMFYWRFFVKF